METRSLLSEFQDVCRKLLPPKKQEFLEKLFKKQTLLYEEADGDFAKSAELKAILNDHLRNLKLGENKEKEVFKNIWDLNQSLKGHKKAVQESIQNGTDDRLSKKDDRLSEKDNRLSEKDDKPSHEGDKTSLEHAANSSAPSMSAEGTSPEGGTADMQAKAEGRSQSDDKNQRRIEKLERKLEKLHRAIQKLSERELTLDEMEESCSTHIQEHKLRMRFVKGWEMLCKLKKTSTSTGRAKESRLVYRNSHYREINARVTKLMNKPDYFPDYHDVLSLIGKVNKKYELGIDEVESGLLAREIFVDIGKELKKRRQQDLIQSFGYASFSAANNDPAEADEELQMKLKQNQEDSSRKLTEAMDKFSQEQHRREARGEDLEAASADEEEDPAEEEEMANMNQEDGVLSDDEDEPPAKRIKTKCEDGVNCGTDGVLSGVEDERPAKRIGTIKCDDGVNCGTDGVLGGVKDETPAKSIKTKCEDGLNCGANGVLSSVEDEPPAKSIKTKCDDGVNCGTDSELSDHHPEMERKEEAMEAVPDTKEENTETEGADIDNFLRNDDTAAILTSEDEGTTAAIGKALCLDESDLSSAPSVMSLSDEDNFADDDNLNEDDDDDDIGNDDNFGDSGSIRDDNIAGESGVGRTSGSDKTEQTICAMLGSSVRTGDNVGPPDLGKDGQNLNGFHLPANGQCPKSEQKFIQVDLSCSDGSEAVSNPGKVSASLPNASNGVGFASDRDYENDPIDALGDEGLVPVVECHSYAYIANNGRTQSVGTTARLPKAAITNRQLSSESSIECIEIDSSSPSPSVADEETGMPEESQPEEDVILIPDSD